MNAFHSFSRGVRVRGFLAAAAFGLVLAGCGGDDHENDTPSATSEVPASASQSVAGFIEYLKRLVASSAEMLEPVDVSMVTAPVDETSEPTSLP